MEFRELDENQRALLWLSTAEISSFRVQGFLQKFHTPRALWEAFGQPGSPFFRDAAAAVLKKMHSEAAMDDYIDSLQKKNVHLLFQEDEFYPECLKAISDPPYLLYYAGREECLRMHKVAIVGNRTSSPYGEEMARLLARGLANANVCVVSGLARGIDGAAHRGVLEEDGCTIGVLGSGINVPYPREHQGLLRDIAAGRGLILSEWPLNAYPTSYHFPHRNRIISGLSLATVMVEGRIKSGGMVTVNCALEQGREVFTVPHMGGRPGSEAPLQLLREGALMVTCAKDILEALNLPLEAEKGRPAPDLSPVQRRIVDHLVPETKTADELAQVLAMDPGEVSMELSMMEISGYVAREPGNRYRSLL